MAPHRKMMNTSHLIFLTASVKPPLREKQRDKKKKKKTCKDFIHISGAVEGRPLVQKQDPFQLGVELR